MEMTDELDQAITRHEEAVTEVSQLLLRYREADSSLEELGFRLEQSGDNYVQTSFTLTSEIVRHLQEHPDDDDARTRLAASAAIDAKTAEQAALLSQIQEPAEPGSALQTRQLEPAEAQDLGAGLEEDSQPMFDELRNGNNARGPLAGKGSETKKPSIKPSVEDMLDRAGSDMLGTLIGSVGVLHQVDHALQHFGQDQGHWAQHILDGLQKGWHALRRLLAKAWRLALLKLNTLVGTNVGPMVNTLGTSKTLTDQATKLGGSFVLGKLLVAKTVIKDGDDLIGQNPSKASDAILAGQDVSDHHKRRRRAVPWLNKALPACSCFHVPGIAAQAIGGGILLVYSVWNVHDHIDSPHLPNVRLPGNPGILQAVRSALA